MDVWEWDMTPMGYRILPFPLVWMASIARFITVVQIWDPTKIPTPIILTIHNPNTKIPIIPKSQWINIPTVIES
jgi:hypothetical protein